MLREEFFINNYYSPLFKIERINMNEIDREIKY